MRSDMKAPLRVPLRGPSLTFVPAQPKPHVRAFCVQCDGAIDGTGLRRTVAVSIVGDLDLGFGVGALGSGFGVEGLGL